MLDDERVQPHSLEAERAVLGSALLSERAWPIISGMLVKEDFFRAAHGSIFDALARISARSVSLDMLVLKEDLLTDGKLDEVGGPVYITSLLDAVPSSRNVEHYAAIVREKARLRKAIAVASELMTSAYGQTSDALSLVSDATRKLSDGVGAIGTRPVDVATATDEYTASLDEGTTFVPTGYADIDSLLGGLGAADLVIVAARPSVGKTTFTLKMAEQIAARRLNVAYFSLEMNRAKLAARLLAWRSGVRTTTLERGEATADDVARVVEARQSIEGLPLFIDDKSRTLTEIAAWCHRIRDEQGGLAIAFIDYIQLLVSESKRSRQEEIAHLSSECKRLGKEMGIPIVALSQLSRAPEARTDKRPHISDLRESGALEQDADLAMLLFRGEMYKRTDENEGIAECIVAKNRTGPTGVVRLQFDASFAQFRDLAVGSI